MEKPANNYQMNFRISLSLTSLFLSILLSFQANAQIELDYDTPKSYIIRKIEIDADKGVNKRLLLSLSGLSVGNTISIPGDEITSAIKTIWKQKLFADVEIKATDYTETHVDLLIILKTRPRLAGHFYSGINKSQTRSLNEEIKLKKGDIITEQYLQNIKNSAKTYYIDKGYANPKVDIFQLADSSFNNNASKLKIVIDKGSRTKINEITIEGNSTYTDNRIKRLMKKTKQKGFRYILRSSKFIEDEYISDKRNITSFYIKKGFRDAQITKDSVSKFNEDRINIYLRIDEGNRYYFRNISFSGNTKYSSKVLAAILNIKPGDVYNPEHLELNLRMNPNGLDITSIYMDNGYLFFNVNPIEKAIIGDSIDLEIRIYEGPQATINRVTVSGNDRTNDHVVLRELRSRPGQKFSRADIMRTQRELANLGYFDPEKLDLKTIPDPRNGTVDIEYVVAERPSDQVELSMGWGNGQLVGVLGLSLNNFSLKNLFKKGKWGGPIPMGDGQKLSLRAQSSGRVYQSYNFSFTEPWFGGKKPTSLTMSASHSVYANNVAADSPDKYFLKVSGVSVGVGKRLKWPDDWFTFYNSINYQFYNIKNYDAVFSFSDGKANSISFTHSIQRNSISQPIYPQSGSNISLSLQWTPPVSFVRDIDYANATDQEKYKWIEYHKWRFDADFYLTIVDKLVLKTTTNFGFLGSYNPAYGNSPFERFYMGGDGLSGFRIDGREKLRLRGYQNDAITPSTTIINSDGVIETAEQGGTIFNKFSFELRYPLSLNPQATVYLLTFMEGGNNFIGFENYNPYDLYRSAGVGVRLFLPMFGLIGFDYGWGFDGTVGDSGQRKENGQFHISIGQQF